MIKELNHVGILSGDIEKSIEFYTKVLGGCVIRDAKTLDGTGRFVYVQLCEGVVELIKVAPDSSNRGLAHIAYLIDDTISLDQCYEYLTHKGYIFTVPPKMAASGDGRLAFFNDTSGVSFELIQRKEDIRKHDVHNAYLLDFDHISIQVDDSVFKKCADFYTQDMGFRLKSSLKKNNNEAFYYTIEPDTIELVHCQGHNTSTDPLANISFRVESCSTIKEHLARNGIISDEPKKSYLGNFNMLQINGPDGELIEFIDSQPI